MTMLRSDVTVEQRMHKLCNRLRRQHARNPAILPISAIAAFLLISLLLYLLSSPSTATPHHPSTTTFLHASVLARQSTSDDNGAANTPLQQAGITPSKPQQPLTVRALSALRAQLDTRILVHDFEACIIIRRMMALVGEDREAGRRSGTGEADVDVDTYLMQLRQRVDDELAKKKQQQQPVASTDDSSQQRMAAMEDEWRSKVVALQEQVRELQVEVLEAKEAKAAPAAAGELDEGEGGVAGGADGRRRGVNNRRITFSKIKQLQGDTAQPQQQPQQLETQSLPQETHSLPDVAQSPEEAVLDKQAAQQQAGQPASTDDSQPPPPATPTQQSPAAAAAAVERGEAGAPAVSEDEKAEFVAGIQGGARLRHEREKQEGEEEEELGKRKWKKRWRPKKEHSWDKKDHDDDD